MKIKIKVKNLILILIVLVIVFIWGIPFASLQIANALDNRNSDRAHIFYNRYYNYPFVGNSIKARYIYADSLIDGFSKFQIGFSGWGGGSNTEPVKLEESKKILAGIVKEENLSKSDLDYVERAYKMLLDIAIATNDINMLETWLDFKNPQDSQKMDYTRDMYRAFLFHINRDEDRALEIAESYKDSPYKDELLEVLFAEIYFFKEDYEKSKEILEKVNTRDFADREEVLFGSGRYLDRNYYLENYKAMLGDENKISGRVYFENKPMPFVEIYVQKLKAGLRVGGGNYLGITDKDGYFETVGLKQGTVEIILGLDGVVLTDKVLKQTNPEYTELNGEDVNIDFIFKETLNIISPGASTIVKDNLFKVSWEEVEGADYYQVEPVIFEDPYNMEGNNYRSAIEDENGHIEIRDSHVNFNIEKLKYSRGGLSFSGEEMILEPSGVIGKFLPGIEYPIVVNAYDKDGNIITSSLPLRSYYDKIPSIIREGELSKGEKLILNKQYPKAIEHYEKILEKEPKDAQALLYLTKIYAIGWKDGEKDYTKALSYARAYEEAVSKGGMLFGVINYMDFSDIEENQNIVKEVLDKVEKHDEDYYYILAQINIIDKQYQLARDNLEKLETYLADDLVYLNIYLGDYKKAIENLKSDKYYPSLMSSSKTLRALESLENSGASLNDKKILDEFLLKLLRGELYESKDEVYKRAMSQLKDKNILTIIDQIYRDYNWLDS